MTEKFGQFGHDAFLSHKNICETKRWTTLSSYVGQLTEMSQRKETPGLASPFIPTCFFCAETFWSLRHFVHLSHSYIKTRHNSVHHPVFSHIFTEMISFFSVIWESFRPMTEKEQIPTARRSTGRIPVQGSQVRFARHNHVTKRAVV